MRRTSNIFRVIETMNYFKNVSKENTKNTRSKIPVQPLYQTKVNMNFQSPLEKFIIQITYIQNENLTKEEVKEYVETKRDMEYWRSRFSQKEIAVLKKDFKSMSYDGVTSQSQILKYLGLEQ